MAKKAASNAASLNPDNYVSGGLPDNFDGTIVKAVFCPWDYNGNIDKPVLAAAITIKPNEDSDLEEFTQHYSAGDLSQFVPSKDGEEAVDLELLEQDEYDTEDVEGPFALRVGKKEGLNNNTNFAQFMTALVECGFDTSKIGASIEFLEGVSGHFDRVPQKKRSGIVRDDEEGGNTSNRTKDVLVLSSLSKVKGKVSTKKAKPEPEEDEEEEEAPKTKAKKSAKADTGGDLDEALTAIVVEALEAADGKPVKKSDLGKLVLKSKDIDMKQKGKAVKRIGDAEFLGGSDLWNYDEEKNTISIGGDEDEEDEE